MTSGCARGGGDARPRGSVLPFQMMKAAFFEDSTERLMAKAVQALADPTDGALAWRAFLHSWVQNCDAISQALGAVVPHHDRVALMANLLIPILQNAFRDEESAHALFTAAQNMGAHVLPVHYYSPVPDTNAIDNFSWTERFDRTPGWDLGEQKQLELLEALAMFGSELEELRNATEGTDLSAFDWSNPAFNQTDAALYYSMIRRFRPKQIIEVGAGHSTRIAAKACLRFLPDKVALEAIEPYPPAHLSCGITGLSRLSAIPVQAVEISRFKSLEANDILFIDSSHVCRIGSDVNYLFGQVLPQLARGVIVHLHDIFLPWNLPADWVINKGIFWNEQYILLAWLHGNTDYEVLLASHFLGRVYDGHLRRAFRFLHSPGGSSFWIRRKT
jgi:hypothetical protein